MKKTLKKLSLSLGLATSLVIGSNAIANEPFIGEIAWVPYTFAPRGWAFCNGQLLPIASNQALFALLGTTYGGDGRTTFGLPEVRGRAMMHAGQGPGLTRRNLGEKLGEEEVTLNVNQMPSHTHSQQASNGSPNSTSPEGNALASPSRSKIYADNANVAMAGDSITNAGGNQAHNNMQPYTVLHCIIALQGIFPSRN